MSLFLVLMIAGLFGLALMAVPGLNRHAHSGMTAHGQVGGHVAGGSITGHSHAVSQGAQLAARGVRAAGQGAAKSGGVMASLFVRLVQPRVIFGLLALYGAFGYALTETKLLGFSVALIVAAVPALLLERYAVTPLWNMLLGFQGKPCSPLEDLILQDAVAVTPFRNGKGIVSVVRDGRAVQMSARLLPEQISIPIKVGDTMHVEDVDAAQERVTVSLR